jgi:mRNA interferase MazF
MTEGDVVLTPLPQADGCTKPRPAILLRQVPPFGDWLVYGVSTQWRQEVAGFDEIIDLSHSDFRSSGLKATSLIRLGYLVVLPADRFLKTGIEINRPFQIALPIRAKRLEPNR